MTPDEAWKSVIIFSPPGVYTDEVVKTLKEAIDCLMIYIKNTTIDCIQPIKEQAYVVSIRSKITKQVDYEKVIRFFKKNSKEEYEKCLNIFTLK
jgi:hypothetical protein